MIPSPVNDPIIRGVCQGYPSQYSYTLLQLIHLPILLIRIKGIQIGENEIKTVSFAGTTIFLTDITCLNRIRVILKYEVASSSKISFPKTKAYEL